MLLVTNENMGLCLFMNIRFDNFIIEKRTKKLPLYKKELLKSLSTLFRHQRFYPTRQKKIYASMYVTELMCEQDHWRA